MKPNETQPCRYCEEEAKFSLVYDGGHFPCCSAHEEEGRTELRRLRKAVKDRVEVVMWAGIPGTLEWRMNKARECAPTRSKPTAESNFGQRISRKQARSAVAEAEVSPNARPIKVISLKDAPDTFLKALGTDWKRLHALRVNSDRITVTVDGQKYTLFSRRG